MSNTCSKCKGTGTIWREGSIHGEDFCDMCGGTGKKITAELVIQLRAELASRDEIIRKLKDTGNSMLFASPEPLEWVRASGAWSDLMKELGLEEER